MTTGEILVKTMRSESIRNVAHLAVTVSTVRHNNATDMQTSEDGTSSLNCLCNQQVNILVKGLWQIAASLWEIHTQPFYGSVEFVRENPGEPVPEETFTHYSLRSHQSSLSAFSI